MTKTIIAPSTKMADIERQLDETERDVGGQCKTVTVSCRVKVVPLPINYTIVNDTFIYDLDTGIRWGCICRCALEWEECGNRNLNTLHIDGCPMPDNLVLLPSKDGTRTKRRT
jgi:hypothetical protein